MIFSYKKFDIGIVEISYKDGTLHSLDFVDSVPENNQQTEFSDYVFSNLLEYFEGKRKLFDIPLYTKGTKFQEKVWEALKTIPYGQTRTYKEIATMIGKPKAYRAVGNANNKNKISIIIPCHRVIGSNGKLVGYASGIGIKEELLKIERA